MVVTFKEENTASFKHLFLKDYADSDDTLAVYTQSDVYDHMFYAIEQVMYNFDIDTYTNSYSYGCFYHCNYLVIITMKLMDIF